MPPPRSRLFQFHAVFGKIWQNCILAPPGELAPPPWGNPGSTTGVKENIFQHCKTANHLKGKSFIIGGSQERHPRHSPTHGPKISQFHAVFLGNIWQNRMLEPCWRVSAPLTGNSGSAKGYDHVYTVARNTNK